MSTFAAGLDYVDLHFLGRPQIIATAIITGPPGVALVDPGPSTTLPHLRESLHRKGLAMADVRQLLLTHIHLDHAGATGSIVKENPAIEVFVHERGAPHMIDPSKLLASATRLYGERDMDRLWGEFLAVPAERVRVLAGGERIHAGGRELNVAYTPGHAWHHVSYFDPSTGVAFVGDTAGIRRGASTYIMPPTPPPDIELDTWRASVSRIREWNPASLFLTHFGPHGSPAAHLDELLRRLQEWGDIARRLVMDASMDEDARERGFVAEILADLRKTVGDEEAEGYSRAGRIDYSWQGLSRYWRKREGSALKG